MKTLTQIQNELAAGQFEFRRHVFRRAVERNIGEQEIREAGAKAEIIESSDATKIITIYEPDPNEWIENRKRR